MLRRATRSLLRSVSLRGSSQSSKAAPMLLDLYAFKRAEIAPHRIPLHAQHLSTDALVPSVHMTEHEFMELADKTLHDIQCWFDGIEEMLEECDIVFSQGVLKIDLGEHGTWVINRQVPNRQIWWSSPLSGPRRYEYEAERGLWVNTRDKGELTELLHTEILNATGIEIHT